MKRFFYLSLAAAAMLAVGCNKENEEGKRHEVSKEADGFLAFNLSLPSTQATKANDDFADGSPDEYRVEDIVLMIFTGQNEDNAVFASAYNLSDQRSKFLPDGNEQITSSAKIVAQIRSSEIPVTDSVFAFVVLNDHQFFSVREDGDVLGSNKLYTQSDTEQHGGSPVGEVSFKAFNETTPITFKQMKRLALDESGRNFSNSSFFMSNAPVASTNANANFNGKITTLALISRSKIFATRNQAEQNPAGTVNVERALAKVTVNFSTGTEPGNSQTTGNLTQATSIPYELIGWDLDNYNLMGFIVRNFDDSDVSYGLNFNKEVNFLNTMKYAHVDNNKYRFTAANPIENSDYRTYWGQDVNYRNVGTLEALTDGAPLVTLENQALTPTQLSQLRGNGSTYYTPENTFDIDHQTERNTTRIIIAAKINGGKSFFTLQEHATTIYPDLIDERNTEYNGSIQQYLTSAVANRVNVRNWMTTYLSTGNMDQNGDWAENLFAFQFVDALTTDDATVAHAAVPGLKYVKVTINPDADPEKFKAGQKEVAINAFNTGDIKKITQDYLATSFKLHYYDGGISYYPVLIKHFGNDETPWKEDASMTNTIDKIYGPDKDKNYLGRYGILRNNWYNLTVTGVSRVGSSVVPPLTDNPDDVVETYISVKVNILPWAKREQGSIVL